MFPSGDWVIRLRDSPFQSRHSESTPTRRQIVMDLRHDMVQLGDRIASQIRRVQ